MDFPIECFIFTDTPCGSVSADLLQRAPAPREAVNKQQQLINLFI